MSWHTQPDNTPPPAATPPDIQPPAYTHTYTTSQIIPPDRTTDQQPSRHACPNMHNPAKCPTNRRTRQDLMSCACPNTHNLAERPHQPANRAGFNGLCIPGHTQTDGSSPGMALRYCPYISRASLRGIPQVIRRIAVLHNSAQHTATQRGTTQTALRHITVQHDAAQLTSHRTVPRHSTTHITSRYIMAHHATPQHNTQRITANSAHASCRLRSAVGSTKCIFSLTVST